MDSIRGIDATHALSLRALGARSPHSRRHRGLPVKGTERSTTTPPAELGMKHDLARIATSVPDQRPCAVCLEAGRCPGGGDFVPEDDFCFVVRRVGADRPPGTGLGVAICALLH